MILEGVERRGSSDHTRQARSIKFDLMMYACQDMIWNDKSITHPKIFNPH
jgi:hypothetical protein